MWQFGGINNVTVGDTMNVYATKYTTEQKTLVLPIMMNGTDTYHQAPTTTHLHDRLWTLCSNLDVCFWGSPVKQKRKWFVIHHFRISIIGQVCVHIHRIWLRFKLLSMYFQEQFTRKTDWNRLTAKNVTTKLKQDYVHTSRFKTVG